MYLNEKIKRLITERNQQISYYDREIEKEIQKEKARHKFSWSRFALVIFIFIMPPAMYQLNTKIFPKTSIWSWDYYIK